MRTEIAAAASLALVCASSAYADDVHDALEAYALYQNDVSTLLDADINGRTVDAALARIQRHDSNRVASGWIAYGALTAAQSPRFADAIQDRIRDGRAPLLRALREDVTYARQQQGASAVQLILTAASADNARLVFASDRYDRYAHSAASTRRTAVASNADLGGETRLSADMLDRLRGAGRVRSTSDSPTYGSATYWDSLAGREARAARGSGGREQSVYASVTDHMLTLAALVVADATQAERRRVSELLDEPLTQNCMHMQRLQLRQCLSVSVDNGERAYCLAHHGLEGPGACFANVVR
jgi:hypothetical protein